MLTSANAGIGNSGAQPRKCTATAVATTEEIATGMNERRAKFEEQQFDGHQDSGQGRDKCGGHAGGGARSQQTRRW